MTDKLAYTVRGCLAVLAAASVAAWMGVPPTCVAAEGQVPIIVSTDLIHPPDDPDDIFDVATLFALTEFDIRGIVLDDGRAGQQSRPGGPKVEQMMHITGRKVKYASGLQDPLRNATDRGLWQAEESQRGVKLILDGLRESKEKVTLLSTGSCIDFAAAYNREPGLFREKVKAVYGVVGTGGNGDVAQDDWNARMDPQAYYRMFELGVPFYWCGTRPKLNELNQVGPYSTSYYIDQEEVLGACALPVQDYFAHSFMRSSDDPIAFLSSGPHPLSGGTHRTPGGGGRPMWCPGLLCHAAGREIYQRGPSDFVALAPSDAAIAGLARRRVAVFDFVPMAVRLKQPGASMYPLLPGRELGKSGRGCVLSLEYQPTGSKPNAMAFHRLAADLDYRAIMESVLRSLLASLDRKGAAQARR